MDVQLDYDDVDGRLTISTEQLHFAIAATADELTRLVAVQSTDWAARRTLSLGRHLGHSVYWCRGETADTVHVLVGSDDETWEVAIVLPAAVVTRILQLAAGT